VELAESRKEYDPRWYWHIVADPGTSCRMLLGNTLWSLTKRCIRTNVLMSMAFHMTAVQN
jgi:hypothetical protein